jgi:hypothetical protein
MTATATLRRVVAIAYEATSFFHRLAAATLDCESGRGTNGGNFVADNVSWNPPLQEIQSLAWNLAIFVRVPGRGDPKEPRKPGKSTGYLEVFQLIIGGQQGTTSKQLAAN